MTADSPISNLKQPWLQLPPKTGKGGATETLKNHEAFIVYRDLPTSERSIALAARRLGKNEKLLEKWSSKFYWPERVAAWQRGIEEIEAERRLQQVRAKAERLMQREEEVDEQKHEVADEVIAKGRTLLKLPATERVIQKQDGSNVTVRPSRSAKHAADLL